MRCGHLVYRFGEFELDSARARLLRSGARVRLGNIPLAILGHLIVHAPHVVSKDGIAKAGWGGIASASSIEKAISTLRQAIGDTDGSAVIATVPGGGYRFVAPVEEVSPLSATADSLDDEGLQALITGRRELATLSRRAIERARRGFEQAIQADPDCAPAHVALAMADALLFEATRFDCHCEIDLPQRAVQRARIGVTLDPDSADAWSTLGFALAVSGEPNTGAIAAWKAVVRERSWQHSIRLAHVSWGEERVAAAHAALALRPHLALAYWLEATVLMARGAFEAALSRLADGCAAQDSQRAGTPSYPGVGLHLLRGLVLAAQDRLDEALRAFDAELATPIRDQLYSQECAANTWYAQGAVRLRRRDFSGAEAAFQRALDIAPMHFVSMAALGRAIPALSPTDPRATDAALARAVALARGNRHGEAAHAYADALTAARLPNAGWMLPVEPILHPGARGDVWAPVLTIVHERAT